MRIEFRHDYVNGLQAKVVTEDPLAPPAAWRRVFRVSPAGQWILGHPMEEPLPKDAAAASGCLVSPGNPDPIGAVEDRLAQAELDLERARGEISGLKESLKLLGMRRLIPRKKTKRRTA